MKIKYNREVLPQDLSGHVLIPNSTNEPPLPQFHGPLSPTASCKPWGGTSVPRTRTASTPSATTSMSWLWILRRLLRWSHRSVWLFWRCFRRRQLHFPFVVQTIVNISISRDVIMQKTSISHTGEALNPQFIQLIVVHLFCLCTSNWLIGTCRYFSHPSWASSNSDVPY